MFERKNVTYRGREAILVSGLKYYSLKDTMLCGQCFRYEISAECEGYIEFLIPVKNVLIRVGQRKAGELIFYEVSDKIFDEIIVPFFNLETDFEKIRREIIKATYENAVAQGDKNVYFIDGKALMRLCHNEGTVDNCHPNDWGFYSMASALIKVLKKQIKL